MPACNEAAALTAAIRLGARVKLPAGTVVDVGFSWEELFGRAVVVDSLHVPSYRGGFETPPDDSIPVGFGVDGRAFLTWTCLAAVLEVVSLPDGVTADALLKEANG